MIEANSSSANSASFSANSALNCLYKLFNAELAEITRSSPRFLELLIFGSCEDLFWNRKNDGFLPGTASSGSASVLSVRSVVDHIQF